MTEYPWKCEGGTRKSGCPAYPLWKVRAKGDKLERNWFYACGRHINEIARDTGRKLDMEFIAHDD